MAQNPLLGKRISLISKKNIRYEGLLYSINEQNMTVALQNVRSYGTEGRELEPVTDPTTGVVTTSQFVPPNDDVHAYLLFRGQDIKDLHVHESQPEPAVVVAATPAAAPVLTEPVAPPPPTTAAATPSTIPVPAAPATTEAPKPTARSAPPPPKAAGRGGGGRGGPRKPPEVTGVGTGSSLLSPEERRAAPTTAIEDFDFAQAATEATDAEPQGAPAVAAYAKDDFFDSISCEALDKQAGVDNRLRGNQERRLNTETFGAVALNNNSRRRGGRGSSTNYSSGRGGRAGGDTGRSGRGRGGDGGRGRGRGARSGGRGGRGRGGYAPGGRQSAAEGMPRPAATTTASS